MAYYIDLKKISIDQYKKQLKAADLIPSWQILLEDIDERMSAIKQQQVRNLADLKMALKSKTQVLEFSKQSGVPEDYLLVLRRVVNGLHPKPNRWKDFPDIPKSVRTCTENSRSESRAPR